VPGFTIGTKLAGTGYCTVKDVFLPMMFAPKAIFLPPGFEGMF
jgi:hypothetical protein